MGLALGSVTSGLRKSSLLGIAGLNKANRGLNLELSRETRAELKAFKRELQKLPQRVLNRARKKISTLYKREIRLQIDASTTKRSGNLRKSPQVLSRRVRRGKRAATFLPNFPATNYITKNLDPGQYAFVLNAKRGRAQGFIGRAAASMTRNPKLNSILNKAVKKEISRITKRMNEHTLGG